MTTETAVQPTTEFYCDEANPEHLDSYVWSFKHTLAKQNFEGANYFLRLVRQIDGNLAEDMERRIEEAGGEVVPDTTGKKVAKGAHASKKVKGGCSDCKRVAKEDPEHTVLPGRMLVGLRWNTNTNSYRLFRGRLCSQHIEESDWKEGSAGSESGYSFMDEEGEE